jgi:hypothetical protein
MNRFVLKCTFIKIYIYHFPINIFIKMRSQSYALEYALETVSLSKTTSFTKGSNIFTPTRNTAPRVRAYGCVPNPYKLAWWKKKGGDWWDDVEETKWIRGSLRITMVQEMDRKGRYYALENGGTTKFQRSEAHIARPIWSSSQDLTTALMPVHGPQICQLCVRSRRHRII